MRGKQQAVSSDTPRRVIAAVVCGRGNQTVLRMVPSVRAADRGQSARRFRAAVVRRLSRVDARKSRPLRVVQRGT